MPIYSYRPAVEPGQKHTHNTGAVEGRECCYFDVLQSISETELNCCPVCNRSVVRAITAPYHHMSKDSAASTPSQPLPSVSSHTGSSAQRAAQLAAGHVCSAGCKH